MTAVISRDRIPVPEDKVQASIVEHIRAVAPWYPVMAIPNGGRRDMREAKKLKSTGVLAGAPDLLMVLPEGRCLWIEVKAPGGDLAKAQIDLHQALLTLGHEVIVARSINDVQAALRRLGVQTREAAA